MTKKTHPTSLRYIQQGDDLTRKITDERGVTTEDKIMNIWSDHEDTIFTEDTIDKYSSLSPEDKANIDLSAEVAMEEMYTWDKHYNPTIVGSMDFEQYLSEINPVLITQRADINKNAKFDEEGQIKKGTYLGTSNDIINSLSSQEFTKELKQILKNYGGNVDKMKQSIRTLKETKEYIESSQAAEDAIKEKKITMFDKVFDKMKVAGSTTGGFLKNSPVE